MPRRIILASSLLIAGICIAKVITLDIPDDSVSKVADCLESAGLKDQADSVRKQNETPPAPKQFTVAKSEKNASDQSTLDIAGDVTADLQGGSVVIDGKAFTVVSADYDAKADQTHVILPKGQTATVKDGTIDVPAKAEAVAAEAVKP